MSNNSLAQAEIIRIAAEAGAKMALETLDKEKRKAQKSRHDKRLRNTKLLLRNYRMFKAHTKNAVFEEAQLKENAIDILDEIWDETGNSDLFVESIRRSVIRTTIIMTHVSDMIGLYEMYCLKSNNPVDARRFRVINGFYIDDAPMAIRELAESECIDNRTVYKDIDAASEKLSALIFGIDGLKKE